MYQLSVSGEGVQRESGDDILGIPSCGDKQKPPSSQEFSTSAWVGVCQGETKWGGTLSSDTVC